MKSIKKILTALCFIALSIQLTAQGDCEKDISTNPIAPYNSEFAQAYDTLTNPWINSNFDIGTLSGSVKRFKAIARCETLNQKSPITGLFL